MRIYKSKPFAKFAKKEGISDKTLCNAIRLAEDGKIDADYGGGVIKQRIARKGHGKSGGYRSILFYRRGNKAFFVFGFAKKDQENLGADEVKFYKESAKIVLAFSERELAKYINNGVYQEVICGDKKI